MKDLNLMCKDSEISKNFFQSIQRYLVHFNSIQLFPSQFYRWDQLNLLEDNFYNLNYLLDTN